MQQISIISAYKPSIYLPVSISAVKTVVKKITLSTQTTAAVNIVC